MQVSVVEQGSESITTLTPGVGGRKDVEKEEEVENGKVVEDDRERGGNSVLNVFMWTLASGSSPF